MSCVQLNLQRIHFIFQALSVMSSIRHRQQNYRRWLIMVLGKRLHTVLVAFDHVEGKKVKKEYPNTHLSQKLVIASTFGSSGVWCCVDRYGVRGLPIHAW